MRFSHILLGTTTVGAALMAGLFYAYAVSVNWGLGRLGDGAYLSAMQSINRAILNPFFLCVFMGTLLLLPVAALVHYGQPLSVRFCLLVIATLVYAVGVFGVTVAGNVPLNEALDKFDITAATPEALHEYRLKFEVPWNRLNTIRTLASIVASILTIAACLCAPKVLLK